MTMRRKPIAAFDVLARQLAGKPVPPVPALPGRVYAQPVKALLADESDPFAERWAQGQDDRQGATWLQRRSTGPAF